MRAFVWPSEEAVGSWNMALDAAMLEEAARREAILLRVYQWSEPTLSLGYFQDFSERNHHPSLVGLACVRRETGGGAILHHHEWTYSIAVPESVPQKGHSEELYRSVHRAVAEWLTLNGFSTAMWEEQRQDQSIDDCDDDKKGSFMCFERRSPVDLVSGDQKIMGSAQRRTRRGLLQHGSLLLAPSPYYPNCRGLGLGKNFLASDADGVAGRESEGLKKLEDRREHRRSQELTMVGFVEILRLSINRVFGCNWSDAEPSSECLGRAQKLNEEFFISEKWVQSRRR